MMSPEDQKNFDRLLDRSNIQLTILLAAVMFVFGILLLILDVIRYSEGKFQEDPSYFYLFLTHLSVFLLCIPAIFTILNRRSIEDGNFKYSSAIVYINIVSFAIVLVTLSLVALYDHGNMIAFGVLLILINIAYQIPERPKIILNIFSSVVIVIGMAFIVETNSLRFVFLIETSGVAILTYLISRFQFRLRKSNFLFNLKLRSQNKEIKANNSELMMQSLQSQMNPHFIFNTLNSIQHFLIFNDTESSSKYLTSFAQLMRKIFKFSRAPLISLKEELDFLDLYIELETLRFETKIEVETNLDPDLRAVSQNLGLPPLLIQPIIENAFKHGLMHLMGLGNLKINFELRENNLLQCTIEDNGVGRIAAKKLESQKSEKKSAGLEIVKKRMDVYQNINQFNHPPNFIIEDIYKNTLEACGTRVIIQIPLKEVASEIETLPFAK